jgi:hypothetical protein
MAPSYRRTNRIVMRGTEAAVDGRPTSVRSHQDSGTRWQHLPIVLTGRICMENVAPCELYFPGQCRYHLTEHRKRIHRTILLTFFEVRATLSHCVRHMSQADDLKVFRGSERV